MIYSMGQLQGHRGAATTSRGGLKGGPRSNQHPAHSQLIAVILVMSPNLCVCVSYHYMWEIKDAFPAVCVKRYLW